MPWWNDEERRWTDEPRASRERYPGSEPLTADPHETGARPGFARGPDHGRGPRRWKRSDEAIYEDVCERMTDHGYLDASGIEVTVSDCEVTLAGSVDDRRQKRLAEDIADSVRGVRDVHNRLVIGPERDAPIRQTRQAPGSSTNR